LHLRHPSTEHLVPVAWACDVAVMTVWYWRQSPARGELHFPFAHDSFPYGDWVDQVEGRRYVLDLPVRGPSPGETLTASKNRIEPFVRAQLKADWLAARGGSSNDEVERLGELHVKWFVDYQVNELSYRAAAARHRTMEDEKTVRFATERVARALGLERRPSRRGRPSKKRP
jgi:hypothetical protein